MNTYIDMAVAVISVFALFVSYFSYKESRKARIEFGQSFLSINLIQISGELYAVLRNIGNTYAYDLEINVSDNFVNGFESLSILQPNTAYGFLLLNAHNVSQYPEKVVFKIKYHDYYSQKKFIEKKFAFKLVDYLRYDMHYNTEFQYYDIKKSF